MAHAPSAALTDRFAAEAARGLQQASFDISSGATAEIATAEVARLFAGIDSGRATPLDFGDASRA